MAGKLGGRGGNSVNSVGPGKLFFIQDSISGKKFLVDTGSSFSIIPHKSTAPTTGPKLWSANNKPIQS